MSCLLFNIAIEPLAESIQQSSLKGFELPNLEEHLIASLFADDTTIFLSDDDEFADLQQILDECDFQMRIIQNRKIKEGQSEIPSNIHTAWANQIQKIDSTLEMWNKSNPTMEGQKKIVVGGMTQYLAQVQGMSKETEKLLTKRIRLFLWGEKTQSPPRKAKEARKPST
ncbi:hypothetical protein L218DRAFT_974830 [Marasmius fiardii PR-910]|nr:hypothetical protein L218DRAFT_974830 [Marasmius fiardii PR-910]